MFLSADEAAAVLRCNADTVRRYCADECRAHKREVA